MLTHGWALEVHMCICGLSHEGSSNVPAFSHSRSSVNSNSYSLECVEGTFSEVRMYGVLRNTQGLGPMLIISTDALWAAPGAGSPKRSYRYRRIWYVQRSMPISHECRAD